MKIILIILLFITIYGCSPCSKGSIDSYVYGFCIDKQGHYVPDDVLHSTINKLEKIYNERHEYIDIELLALQNNFRINILDERYFETNIWGRQYHKKILIRYPKDSIYCGWFFKVIGHEILHLVEEHHLNINWENRHKHETKDFFGIKNNSIEDELLKYTTNLCDMGAEGYIL